MPLATAYTDPSTKLALPVAYVRILSLHIDALAQTIEVKLGIYSTAAAQAAGGTPLFTYSAWPPFSAITSGPIDLVQASYDYVRSLPVFSGSVVVA